MKKSPLPHLIGAGFALMVTLSLCLSGAVTTYSQDPEHTPVPPPANSPVLIESDDPLVMRDGSWTAQDTPSASGGSYLYASGSPDDVLTLEFEGPSVEIIYVKHPAFGTLAIEIDGVVVRTVITTAQETEFDARAAVNYLEAGPHVLKVYAAEGTVAVDAFVAAVPLAQASTPLSVSTPCEAYTIVRTSTQLMQALSFVKPRQDSGQYCLPFTIYISDNNNQIYTFASELQVSGHVFLKGFDENPTLSPVGKPPSTNPVPDIILDSNSGSAAFGVMRVTGGSTVVIRNLTITGGDNTAEFPDGGQAENCGGGIRNYGDLTLLDSALIDNRADVGGAICNGGYPNYPATLTVERTVFERNVVVGDALNGTSGGGAIMNWRGQLSASCSRFDANRSGHMGAAIFNENTATASIANNRFLNNAITITPIPPSYGRDIHNRSGTSTVEARYNRSTPVFHTYGDVLVHPTLTSDPTVNPGCQYSQPPSQPPAPPPPSPPPNSCRITLIASEDAQISQMAKDMKAIAGTNGLYLHAAPAINAPRVYFEPASTYEFYEFINPIIRGGDSISDTVNLIPWGKSIDVNTVYVFIDKAGQIWYGLEGNTYQSSTRLSQNIAWMAVKVFGEVANTVDDYYVYVTPPTSGTLESPCLNTSLPSDLTFPYHRAHARDYAALNGYNNRGSRAAYIVNRYVSQNVSFANFTYSSITHVSGATGSAVFVSESLWMGGMPFLIKDPQLYRPLECLPSLVATNADAGWAFCQIPNQNGSPTNVFQKHWEIVAYYTDTTVPIPSSGDNKPLNSFFVSPKGTNVSKDQQGNTIATFILADFINVVDLPKGDVTDSVALQELISASPVTSVKAGDYLWIDSLPDPHGFVVVGWGNALNCANVPDTYSSTLDLQIGWSSMTDGRVPWVVDFSHGIVQGSTTTETQKSVPRPFYCSRYKEEGYSFFNVTEWWFFQIPNAITINQGDRLFVQPSWVWNATAGERQP